MRAYKFRLYPSEAQEKELNRHLWIEKNLWNTLLEKTKEKYEKEQTFLSVKEMREYAKGQGLYSQAAQSVVQNLDRSLKAKIRAKRKGLKWGFPRFKSFDRMRSILYPQSGFSLDKKLDVSPFGEIPIVRHRMMKGKIKTLCLKRELSGKWHAIFTVEQEPPTPRVNHGPAVGLDLGLNRLATLSDGKFIENPRIFRQFERKLAQEQRLLSKKRKGSHNRAKAKKRVALVHEKMANARKDYLHKTANRLLSNYSKIVMEDLGIKEMAEEGHGKGIHDASWGMFTHMLCYKAASAGSEVVLVNPKNTSKECSGCHAFVQKGLWERTHHCPSCGLVLDRDINAAINILTRATAGMAGNRRLLGAGGAPSAPRADAGSNACGDEAKLSSLKQDATRFSGW